MAHSMVGDYRSLAEVDGAAPPPLAWTPGADFDPDEPAEVAVVFAVTDRHAAERAAALARENNRLRELLAEATGDGGDGYDERDDWADPYDLM